MSGAKDNGLLSTLLAGVLDQLEYNLGQVAALQDEVRKTLADLRAKDESSEIIAHYEKTLQQ